MSQTKTIQSVVPGPSAGVSVPFARVVICSKCGSHLQPAKDLWACPACDAKYRSLPGMVSIDPAASRYRDITGEQVRSVLSCARQEGWMQAVMNARENIGSDQAKRILGKGWGDWIFQVALRPKMRALDLASGWGAMAFCLRHQVEQVCSLEADPDMAQFQQLRRKQSNASNILVVNSKWISPPFRPNSFDLITIADLNRALSMVRKELDLIDWLSRLRKLLKPGGSLYLTGPTRPTRQVNGSAELLLQSGRKIFQKAGFMDTERYWIWPGWSEPFQSARTDNRAAFRFFIQRRSSQSVVGSIKRAVLRTAGACGATRLVTSGAAVVARAEGRRGSAMIEKVCHVLRSLDLPVSPANALRWDRPLTLLSSENRYIQRTRTRWVLLHDKTHDPLAIVKIPRFREGAEWLTREKHIFATIATKLDRLNRHGDFHYLEINGWPVLAERFFHGKSSRDCLNSAEKHERIIRWLAKLHDSAQSQDDLACPLEQTRSLLKQLADCSKVDSHVVRYGKIWLAEAAGMPTPPVPRVPVHGDFTPGNILLSSKSVFVTDWEWAELRGVAWQDFWAFELSSAFALAETADPHSEMRCVLAQFSGDHRYALRLRHAARVFREQTNMPAGTLACGLLWTILSRVLRDISHYGHQAMQSRHYRLFEHAARTEMPLWVAANQIVGAP